MDPRRMRFTMSDPRDPAPDPDNEGLGCEGCLFRRQRSAVCMIAGQEAIARGYRDCDNPDERGQFIVYVRPYQMDLIEGAER